MSCSYLPVSVSYGSEAMGPRPQVQVNGVGPAASAPAPGPSPSPSQNHCATVSSQALLKLMADGLKCTAGSANPVCGAIARAQAGAGTLTAFADELWKMKESDYNAWWQSTTGLKAGMARAHQLALMKCYLAPSDNLSKHEQEALGRIKNWYVTRYWRYLSDTFPQIAPATRNSTRCRPG